MQIDPSKQTLVEWALVPKLVSPMSGYVALANNIRFNFSQINLSIGGQTTTGPYPDMYDVGRCSSGRDSVMGGLIGIEALVESDKGAPADSAYPTGLLVLNGTSGSQINISGSVTVQVYAPNPPGGNFSGVTRCKPCSSISQCQPVAPFQAPIPALALNGTIGWYGNHFVWSTPCTGTPTPSPPQPPSAARCHAHVNPSFIRAATLLKTVREKARL